LKKKIILQAGFISMGSLVISQTLRFAGNIVLTKLLSPSAFGVVGVVNMTMLGINLLSDIGIRYLVIQRQGDLDDEYLNTVWVLQIARGVVIWFIAIIIALTLLLMQRNGIASGVYADQILPFLIAGAASSAVFYGFESTKSITERRDMRLGRVTVIALVAQILSMLVMFAIARHTGSPWALVAGAVAMAFFQFAMSHLCIPGLGNKWSYNKEIAFQFLRKSKLILIWSPLTFLASNAEIVILGGLVDSSSLGNYMIAYLLVNAVYQASSTMSGNVFFPGLSASAREGSNALVNNYKKFQLISDAVTLTAAGILISAGQTIVRLLFDSRYIESGSILSLLAIGLIGLRYSVIEQLANAHGNVKFGISVSFVRLIFLTSGVYIGYQLSGLKGAAMGVGLSWFAGWPMLIWYRAKTITMPWAIELCAFIFLAIGYCSGLVFTKVVILFR